eukprot:11626642-Alexandrium_andersonii.AAC.1
MLVLVPPHSPSPRSAAAGSAPGAVEPPAARPVSTPPAVGECSRAPGHMLRPPRGHGRIGPPAVPSGEVVGGQVSRGGLREDRGGLTPLQL